MSSYKSQYQKKFHSGFNNNNAHPRYYPKIYKKSDTEHSRSRSRERSPIREKDRERSYSKHFDQKSSRYDDKYRQGQYESKYSKSHKYSSSRSPYYHKDSDRTISKARNDYRERKLSMENNKTEDNRPSKLEVEKGPKINQIERRQSSDSKMKMEAKVNESPVYNGIPLSIDTSPSTLDQRSEPEINLIRSVSEFNIEKNELQFEKLCVPLKRQLCFEEEGSDFEVEDEEEKDIQKNVSRKKVSARKIPLTTVPICQDPREKFFEKIQAKEKLNLILDLDETILNSATVPKDFDVKSLGHIPSGYIKEIPNGPDARKMLIIFRPYYKEFLKRVSKNYNIFVYSHGRWEYVKKVLEIIDNDEQYIRRDFIFKNTGQVDSRTQKVISNLGLSEIEANKTIILDDQRYIWGDAQKKVIASKKFIPLKEHMQEEKYMKYPLFNKEGEGMNVPWTLCSKNDPFGLKSYAEFNIIAQTSSQLEPLTNFLEEISKEFNRRRLFYPNGHEALKVENLLERRMKTIITGWKVAVASFCVKRTKMFQELVKMLGGAIVDQEKAEYIFIDLGICEIQKITISTYLRIDKPPTLISIDWLLECFFAGNKADLKDFYVKELI